MTKKKGLGYEKLDSLLIKRGFHCEKDLYFYELFEDMYFGVIVAHETEIEMGVYLEVLSPGFTKTLYAAFSKDDSRLEKLGLKINMHKLHKALTKQTRLGTALLGSGELEEYGMPNEGENESISKMRQEAFLRRILDIVDKTIQAINKPADLHDDLISRGTISGVLAYLLGTWAYLYIAYRAGVSPEQACTTWSKLSLVENHNYGPGGERELLIEDVEYFYSIAEMANSTNI